MGYKIIYTAKKKNRDFGGFLRWQILSACFALLGCYLVSRMWPEGREALQQFLLPESDMQEGTALQVIVSAIRDLLHGV